jgi:hypothetical protein
VFSAIVQSHISIPSVTTVRTFGHPSVQTFIHVTFLVEFHERKVVPKDTMYDDLMDLRAVTAQPSTDISEDVCPRAITNIGTSLLRVVQQDCHIEHVLN